MAANSLTTHSSIGNSYGSNNIIDTYTYPQNFTFTIPHTITTTTPHTIITTTGNGYYYYDTNYDTNQNNKKFIAFFINDDGKMSVRINIKNIITDYTVVDFKNKILKNGDKKMFFIVERKIASEDLKPICINSKTKKILCEKYKKTIGFKYTWGCDNNFILGNFITGTGSGLCHTTTAYNNCHLISCDKAEVLSPNQAYISMNVENFPLL